MRHHRLCHFHARLFTGRVDEMLALAVTGSRRSRGRHWSLRNCRRCGRHRSYRRRGIRLQNDGIGCGGRGTIHVVISGDWGRLEGMKCGATTRDGRQRRGREEQQKEKMSWGQTVFRDGVCSKYPPLPLNMKAYKLDIKRPSKIMPIEGRMTILLDC